MPLNDIVETCIQMYKRYQTVQRALISYEVDIRYMNEFHSECFPKNETISLVSVAASNRYVGR